MSYSPVTLALGAFERNHCLKSLRSALSWARYDLTALLEKSIFFPCGGFVFTYVESGSPLSCTIALLVSMPGAADGPSETGPPAVAPATAIVSANATSATRAPESLFMSLPLLMDLLAPPDSATPAP